MKINRTKLKSSEVSAYTKGTLIGMCDEFIDDKELLTNVSKRLIDDESYPTEFAAQTGQINEQLIYINFNINILVKALKQKGHTYIAPVFVEEADVVVLNVKFESTRYMTEAERNEAKNKANDKMLSNKIKFIDNDGLSRADMNDAINEAIDSHTKMKALINKK